ncbi:Cupredoxin [Mycena belliarum]|uniref:Cupredoxin n=1 Tax=Mycena belliarum TaxID=1033014 RepID=A0AAD6TWV0_9AGAR|nr:Cupredoxin [Mycena belliae]
MRFALGTTLTAATLAFGQTVVKVAVGGSSGSANGIFSFTPSTITAANGTIVSFQFTGAPGNHTVTQSSFAAPCQPLANGFDSGSVFISSSTAPNPPPEWNITVTDDSKPIWFYCKQLLPSPHCTSGMVGAINVQAGSANTFEAFQKAATSDQHPGQAPGGLVGVGASASARPLVAAGATLFPASGASATAPGGSSASSTSSRAAGGSQTPNSADPVVLGFNLNVLTIVAGIIAGAKLVL